MKQRIQGSLADVLNGMPLIKRHVLRLNDLAHQYLPLIVGAFIRNPAYLKHIFNSKVIAAPGFLNFKGGVFNPGALVLNADTLLLIARAQVLPWYKARGKNQQYYMAGNPVTFLLDSKTLDTVNSTVIFDMIGFPSDENFETEDYRLFRWKNRLMVNHSWVMRREAEGFITQSGVKSVLSVLDVETKSFTFFAFPKPDFPLQNFEKNWMYKQEGNRLFLFYSMNPYQVLELRDEERFEFKTVVKTLLSEIITDPGGFGTRVSYSTNPIDFDAQFWLIIIHQFKVRTTGRWYVHWGVLIDKNSLLPVKITSKPIFTGTGARGRVPGYRYISSILKVGNEILFFAGEGDVYVTVTRKTAKDLENLFIDI